ncbi:hypothetical protein GTR02_05720 [Kineococcus sp. R8]|uniref:hypothetical protein n=1 Tax=Kineococcus siccus TaxID=2696567 RepID=UPI0014126B7A|nr:hypothetical protein [Kineococcus siccus]NAZ81309.1 hypothetical protein [Kineococcus siccus]
MLAPSVADLRPGDAVKVRGTGHPAHTGGKAVVAAVHLSRTTPGAVDAVEVRYSARGAALRVELDGPGEMVRWSEPWPAAAAAPHVPVTPVAGAGVPLSRGRVALVLTGVAAGAAVLLLWPHDAPVPAVPDARPTGAVEVVAADDTIGGDGTAWSTATSTLSPTASPAATPSPSPEADGRVVAWSAGPVPVVALPAAAPSAVPLAGVAEAEGCHDAYVEELMRLLPMGAAVDVRGSGYLRTGDGVDVNAQLVRAGVAEPAEATAGRTAADREAFAVVTAAAVPSPARCR